jgi:uncharacterized protein YcfJ
MYNSFFIVMLLLITSCSGTTTGSVVGSMIGDQFGSGNANIASTAGGAAAGAYIGGKLSSATPDEIKAETEKSFYDEFAFCNPNLTPC